VPFDCILYFLRKISAKNYCFKWLMYSYIKVIESQMWDVFETQCSEVSHLHETGKSLCTVSGTFMWRSARTEVGGRNVRT